MTYTRHTPPRAASSRETRKSDRPPRPCVRAHLNEMEVVLASAVETVAALLVLRADPTNLSEQQTHANTNAIVPAGQCAPAAPECSPCRA